MIKRICIYLAGLLILSFGVVLNTKTNLGVAALNAIPFVISRTTSMSLGTAVFWLYTLLIIIQCVLRHKIDLLTVLQLPVSLLFGKVVDFFNEYVLTFQANNIFIGFIMLACAIILVALGTTIVISQDLVPNAPDGCVNVIASTLHKSFGNVKMGFDATCIVIALIVSLTLAHSIIGIGIGTICSMAFTGNLCNYFKKHLNHYLKGENHVKSI